jgi:hypothetical protein
VHDNNTVETHLLLHKGMCFEKIDAVLAGKLKAFLIRKAGDAAPIALPPEEDKKTQP